MTAPSKQLDQFVVRLPDGMRDRIKAAAEANNRSMNAEIVATLERAYPDPLPWREKVEFYFHQLERLDRESRDPNISDEYRADINQALIGVRTHIQNLLNEIAPTTDTSLADALRDRDE